MGSETMGIYPLGAFETQNGAYCLVQVSNDLQWQRFCEVLGAPELAADPRFAGNPLRVKNRDALRPLLQARLRLATAQEWEQRCTAAGVPVSHVRGLADVVAEEQVVARNMIKPTRIKGGREIPTWGVPIKANGEVASRTLAVPGLDEHRDEILAELERRRAGSKG